MLLQVDLIDSLVAVVTEANLDSFNPGNQTRQELK